MSLDQKKGVLRSEDCLCSCWMLHLLFEQDKSRLLLNQLTQSGLNFQEKPWGQPTSKFSDLVASKHISIGEKHGKLIASKKIWSHWRPKRFATLSSISNLFVMWFNKVSFLSF